MKIVFVSNYINHHQIPVSDELYKLTGGDYLFIQTEPMEEERIKMGWDETAANKPYVKLYYDAKEECDSLILTAECVIFGGTEREDIIKPRLEANKLTIRYSERLYKEGRWKFITPRGLKKKYEDHTRFNKSKVYLLCSGAYVAGDFNMVHAYPGKKFKYGYFPEFEEYSDLHEKRRGNEKLEILWAARFIDWKHPETMLQLAKQLKNNNDNAHITMIGTGEMFDNILKEVRRLGLEDYCSLIGAKKPKEVREYMRMADIFVSTSDRKEGWGAVVNEAMNSGCVTLATKEIGAAPYLIEDGKNGFLYRAKALNALYGIIENVSDEKEKRYEIGLNAYKTIRDLWNPEVAAKRLYEFAQNQEMVYKEGPLSKA